MKKSPMFLTLWGICPLFSSCDKENSVIVQLTLYTDRTRGGKCHWKLYQLYVQYSYYIKSMLLSTRKWSLCLMSRHHREMIEKKSYHRGFGIEEGDQWMWLYIHLLISVNSVSGEAGVWKKYTGSKVSNKKIGVKSIWTNLAQLEISWKYFCY